MQKPASRWSRWRQNSISWMVLLYFVCAHGACAEEKRTNGSTCASNPQCGSGLCYHDTCLDPAANDDDDTLLNQQEQLAGTNPFLTDSDGDFIDDGTEVGEDPGHPIDTDGDNDPTLNRKHDALESNRKDSDCDCISDQLDHASEPRATSEILASILCRSEGVCDGEEAAVTATCPVRGDEIPQFLGDDGELNTGCDAYGQQELCSYDGIGAHEDDEALCDGLDNDCDGETDEVLYQGSLGLGDTCEGIGVCVAPTLEDYGVVECATADGPMAGMVVCSRDQGGSAFSPDGPWDEAAEGLSACDQKDNDCDGAIDEDSPGWIPPGGTEEEAVAFGASCDPPGPCGVGSVECSDDGTLVCSTEPGGSEASDVTEETCNTLDDDCDGGVDEGFEWGGAGVGQSCADPAACPSSEVVCVGGEAVCQNTAFEPPLTVTEHVEKCDGVDNDCDGVIDEEDGLKHGCPADGVCEGQEASGALCQLVTGADGEAELLLVCSFVGVIEYEVGGETSCNGKDDDCDGELDEDLVTPAGEAVGEPCQGVGACEGTQGVVVCGDDGITICKVAAEESPEICNGLDDDCDGFSDEAPLWVPEDLGCKEAGLCSLLEQSAVCIGGDWTCAYDLEPGLEGYEEPENSCDGLDNDCDGVVDEGTGKVFLPEPVALTSAQPPHRRRWVVAAASADQPLLMGGLFTMASGDSETGAALDDVWTYNQGTGTWQLVDGAGVSPPARYGHAMAAVPDAGLVVVHGGYEYGIAGFQLSDAIYVYEVENKTWHLVSQLLGTVRARHTLTPVPGGGAGWQLVLHGGIAGENEVTSRVATLSVDAGEYTVTWETLDPASGANQEPCRMDHGAAWDGVGERLIVVGGVDCLDEEVFMPIASLSLGAEPQWTTVVAQGEAPSPGLTGTTVVSDDNTLYVVATTPEWAGADAPTLEEGIGNDETHAWALDLSQETWVHLASGWLPGVGQTRHPAVWLSGEHLLVAGGSNNQGNGSWRTTWAWDIEEETWTAPVPWAGPPPRVGGTLVVRWDTGDTWLLGGARAHGGKPLQDAWAMDSTPASWESIQTPVAADTMSTVKAVPALESASGTWDPVHQGILLYGGHEDGEPTGELWALALDGPESGFKEITAQGDSPPPMISSSLALAPGGDVAWLVGVPADGDDTSAGVTLYGLSLGSYTWNHLWSQDAETDADQGIAEVVAVTAQQGLKLVTRTKDKKLHLVRLDAPTDGDESWTWSEIGASSSPVYVSILGAALDPVGEESLLFMRGVDGSLKMLLANHGKGTVVVQPDMTGWRWPDGVALAVHPTLGVVTFGGSDSLDVTWGMGGVFAQTCP